MTLVFDVLIIILVVLLMILGVLGVFLPFLPDAFFVLLGAFIYGFYNRFERFGFWTYLVLVILTLLLTAAEYLATLYGAKKFGVSKLAILGGVLGGTIGLLAGNFLGLLIGFILGVMISELLISRDWKKSLRSGGGAVIGVLSGTAVKLFIVLLMIVIFLAAIIM